MPARPPLARALLAAAAALSGCGSATVHELPPAAEPARSPAPASPPAGRIVPVGHGPEGSAFDPVTGLLAIGLRDPDELALLDGATGTVRRRVALPAASRHLQLAAPGGPVLVPAERADALVRVTLPGGRSRSTPTGHAPHDATAAGRRIFVGDEGANTVTVLQDGKAARRIRVATQPGGVATLDGGRRLAVVSVRERRLEIYDTRTLRRVASAPAGVGPTHVVTDGGRFLWVTDTQGDGLLIFRARPKLQLLRRVYLPGRPYGIARDGRHHRLWVTLTATNRLQELPAGSRARRLRTFPTVQRPYSVAADPRTGRVFVTGMTAGVVQLIDP